jgi:hypothetical protein
MAYPQLQQVIVYRPAEIDWGTFFNGFAGMAVLAMAVPIFFTSQSPEQELAEVNDKIIKLYPVMERYRSSVVSLRQRRTQLMKEYGISVTPPLVELRGKYSQLYHTEQNLQTASKELDRIETRMTLLQKRRKELQITLGQRPEELQPRSVYPAMKKFIPPTEYR